MHAELCPVCNGTGRYQGMAQCHGCDGDGWVEVSNNPDFNWPPWNPTYVPYPDDSGDFPFQNPNTTSAPFDCDCHPYHWHQFPYGHWGT